MPAALLVASPQRKVVQHNRGSHRDVQRSCARPVLLDVHEGVAQLHLTLRETGSLQRTPAIKATMLSSYMVYLI